MQYFWPCKPKRTKGLEFFYAHKVGAEAKFIHPWTQLISAFYLRSHFSRCFWRWMEIFSWTWLLSSLCHNCYNNRRWVNCYLLHWQLKRWGEWFIKSKLKFKFLGGTTPTPGICEDIWNAKKCKKMKKKEKCGKTKVKQNCKKTCEIC